MDLIGVSGGPDSMFLLNEYKKRKIIVAHVNYHQRSDSNNDEQIVRSFCQKNNIAFYVLDVKKIPKGNFQNWARAIRYDFFKKIYQENNCQKLIMAHHKDDFLETALMQQASGRTPRYFGIKKQNVINAMRIYRPYINLYWKDFLIEKNKQNKINYATDSSNQKLIYTRNKIRVSLSKKTLKEKESMYAWFVMSNKILKKKFKRVDQKVQKILKNKHSLKCYKQLRNDTKEVIYEIIHKELGQVKLSTNKIEAFIAFINGKESDKKFIINKSNYVHKNAGKLLYNSSIKK